MNFGDITVVNIDGRPGDVLGGQRAVLKSSLELPGSRRLLISPTRPRTLLEGIEHVAIQPMGYFEYGLFVLYALHHFIKTEYALIVQEDGWVLDGNCWRDEYFEYDYIGAPIHFARLSNAAGTRYLRGFRWVEHLNDANSRLDLVYNGGFSLRSRRLLEAPQRLAIPYVIPPVTGLAGPPYRMHWESDAHLEDVYLCLHMRADLERGGVRIAPLALARVFAFEHLHPVIHGDLDLMQVFGHHARVRRLRGSSLAEVEYSMTARDIEHSHGERMVVDMLRRRGYSVRFKS